MDPEVAALAEEQTEQVEVASAAAVEIEAIREEGQTERTEIREEAETERAQIMADAMVEAASEEAEPGVDEEWLRSQFDGLRAATEANTAALSGLAEATTRLTELLAAQSIPTPPEPTPPEPPPPSPPEPTAEPAPAPAAPAAKKGNRVLF